MESSLALLGVRKGCTSPPLPAFVRVIWSAEKLDMESETPL